MFIICVKLLVMTICKCGSMISLSILITLNTLFPIDSGSVIEVFGVFSVVIVLLNAEVASQSIFFNAIKYSKSSESPLQ